MSYATLDPKIRTIAERELTAKQLAVVQARVNGHPWQRIALNMDLDEATVRGHWNRALRRLKSHLNEGDLAA